MVTTIRVFLNSSVGKESACSAYCRVPGLGRSPGEGIGYPLQYSLASIVAVLVKNMPATRETWLRSLDWEDPPEKEMATHSSILAWRIPRMDEPGGLQSTGSQRVGHINYSTEKDNKMYYFMLQNLLMED